MQSLQQAIVNHQAGRLDEAERVYRQVVARDSRQADVWHLLGLLLRQRRQPQAAVDCLHKATALQPQNPLFWNSLAGAHEENAEHAAAVSCYQRQLQFAPNNVDAWYALGNCQHLLGNSVAAETSWRETLTHNPQHLGAQLNLGNTYIARGELAQAEQCYRQVLATQPQHIDAINNLGQVVAERNSWRAALPLFAEAVRLAPAHEQSLCNLGFAHYQLAQIDAAEACFLQALRDNSRSGAALLGLGQVALARGELALAEQHLLAAIAINPRLTEAHNSVGSVYLHSGDWQRADAAFAQALSCDPKHSHALFNRAVLRFRSGELEVARAQLQQLLQWYPHYAMAHPVLLHLQRQLLDWEGCEALAATCRDYLASHADIDLSPFALITLPDSTAEEQRRVAEHWWRRHGPALSARRDQLPSPTPRANHRLRIGYLSADFHAHATAWLLARVIELHNRDDFEVYGYSYGPNDDSTTRARLIAGFDYFRDVAALADVDAAATIRRDGVDILLEVKGHTQNARLGIVALRPAPLQLSYLAYPGTVGGDFLDAIITDRYLTPPALQAHFVEAFAYLPCCYQPLDDTRGVPTAPARAALGIPADRVVLAAFHQAYKLNAPLLDAWADILRAVPNAVLWLLAADAVLRTHITTEFARRGIPLTRLLFAEKVSQEQHLQRIAAADLVLDSFPVNGHTSTADALWAGVPVLTVVGETMISRVAGSILTAIDMPDLIANSLTEYRQMAIAIIDSKDSMRRLKERVIAARSTSDYFNSAVYAKRFDALLSTLWREKIGALVDQ